ncbi:MAG: response regulator transcription factor [Chloroflexota bacterium]|nr:response regulator transcription factor [Chloroflexota bacterium]
MALDQPVARPRVLAVDDDPEILDLLDRGLKIEGFDVRVASDGEAALKALAEHPTDVVVLDVMMPGLDGLAVIHRIRETSDVPVLFLSARERVRDRIAGLEAGGDDYLPKPFAFGELVARLRALLRRPGTPESDLFAFADLQVDEAARQAIRAGTVVPLTATEFDLLRVFMREPRRVLSRERLLEAAWGFAPDTISNVVDVYVGYLRRKLEADGRARLIWTVRGAGYVLREDGP